MTINLFETENLDTQSLNSHTKVEIAEKEVVQFGSGKSEVDQFAVIFADGGSRGNPGPSAYGFVVYTLTMEDVPVNGSFNEGFARLPQSYFEELVDTLIVSEPLYLGGKFVGVATNNQAEWGGLLGGLEWVKANLAGVKNVLMYLDSELVVKQLRGEYKIKNPALQGIASEVKQVLRGFESFRIFHIRREKNGLADKMANQMMDEN